jgi:hypothetical protein
LNLGTITNEELDKLRTVLGADVVQLIYDYRRLHRAAAAFHRQVIRDSGETTALDSLMLKLDKLTRDKKLILKAIESDQRLLSSI